MQASRRRANSQSECDTFVSTYKTWDIYQDFVRAFQPPGTPKLQDLLDIQNGAAGRLVRLKMDDLLDEVKWTALARHPKKFRGELDKTLSLVGRTMTWRYGIASHRVGTNAPRDRKIWELYQGGKTFGQIRQQLGLSSDQLVRQAYHRYQERQVNILRKFYNTMGRIDSATSKKKQQLEAEWLEFVRKEKLA